MKRALIIGALACFAGCVAACIVEASTLALGAGFLGLMLLAAWISHDPPPSPAALLDDDHEEHHE